MLEEALAQGVDATPIGFYENNSRSDSSIVAKLGIAKHWTLLHLLWKLQDLYDYFTMTFDLWPDFKGHVKRHLRSVPFQRLKLANIGIFAADMDMDRCCEVTYMVYTDIVTFPRSTEVIRGQWPFSGFCVSRGNLRRIFWIWLIRLSFICVKIGSLES